MERPQPLPPHFIILFIFTTVVIGLAVGQAKRRHSVSACKDHKVLWSSGTGFSSVHGGKLDREPGEGRYATCHLQEGGRKRPRPCAYALYLSLSAQEAD